ncbi:hypothetical protein HYX18_03995 [Candidatus Woesearchaeota archaeon]|nr:hypothetical protein [Candidatus Woesearchaeota archaeon]
MIFAGMSVEAIAALSQTPGYQSAPHFEGPLIFVPAPQDVLRPQIEGVPILPEASLPLVLMNKALKETATPRFLSPSGTTLELDLSKMPTGSEAWHPILANVKSSEFTLIDQYANAENIPGHKYAATVIGDRENLMGGVVITEYDRVTRINLGISSFELTEGVYQDIDDVKRVGSQILEAFARSGYTIDPGIKKLYVGRIGSRIHNELYEGEKLALDWLSPVQK